MNWLRLTLFEAISLLLVFQNVTRAQSPTEPIKAKQRELSYQIQPDGSRVLKNEQAGVFYRSSSGASIKTMGDRSTFIDVQGDQYEIDHSKKFARLVAHQIRQHELIKSLNIAGPSNILYEAVNGLNCAVIPIYNTEPVGNLNAKPSGKEYLYLPYGLWVRTEFTSTSPEGSLLTIRELYDIQVAEPDPALVRIPEGYLIDNQLLQ